ncbi:MAG: TonB-dependent receptor [Prolixibacteraceae bacterium]|nr:TonB-dependent receptor [Prolixibacteraceae bacterium]
MKLTFIFILLGLMSFASVTYSQSQRLSFESKNATIESVFKQIESLSEFKFAYNSTKLDVDKVISLKVENQTINTVLDKILGSANFKYQIVDRYIIITDENGKSNDFVGAEQSRKVSGKVVDQQGDAIPGVSVVVKGTTVGTITGIDGNFVLDIPVSGKFLTFTFIGMKSVEVPVGAETIYNVTMESDVVGIDEVIAIGYSSTSRRNVASAISKVTDRDIVGLSVTDTRQTLQGKMAGVQVVNNSGDPGSGARIIIRGMGSFSNPDPLYVIDGIQGGDINSVQPQDIESITVLKDASTTAIYGSAAANGVVLITTKSGAKGKVKVQYDGSVGIASVTKRYDLLGTSDYIDLVSDIQKAGGLTLSDKLKTLNRNTPATDWQEIIFRNALVTDHNIRISGGGENTNYAFSAGYQNQESTIIARNFQRATIGAKLDQTLFNKKVRLSQNLRVKTDANKGALANFNDAFRMPPYIQAYDPTNLGGYGRADKVTDLNDANNPLNEVYNSDDRNRSLSVNLELSGEVDLIDGLVFKTQGRLSAGNYNSYEWNYPSNGGNFIKLQADLNENFSNNYGMLWENFFNYNKRFGEHNISATVGNSYGPPGFYRSVSVAGSNYTSDAIQNVALANSNSVTGASVNSGKARISYFGRVGYTFKDRYVLNASFRRDASSVFGENNRWGNFYGLGAAWDIKAEDFMKDVTAISNLKFRVSYGKTGNDNIPAFLTSATVWKGSSNNIVYPFGDGVNFSTGSIVNSVPNPDLKWEETTQTDIGIDISFLKNKLNFVFDYYNRANEDLLIETQIPLTTGLGNPGQVGTMWVNAASMTNSGFESTVTYSDDSKEFKWDVSANLTYSTNEVTALGTVGDLPISKGEFTAGIGNSTRTDIGHPLASYYGYVVDHVAKDKAEVDALNAKTKTATSGAKTEYKTGMKPGDYIMKDIDGNGFVDDKDRTYLGNPAPTWQYGGTFNGTYKAFDIQLLFQGVADVDVVNGGRYWWEGMSKPFNQTTAVLDRWRKEGDVATLPAAGQNSGANLAFSSWYVESGAYFRIKNLTLGYTLPSSLLDGVFSKVRVFASAQNLLTLTKYSGYDPEISSYSPNDNNIAIFARGIDQYQRPNPTTYRFGIQLNF